MKGGVVAYKCRLQDVLGGHRKSKDFNACPSFSNSIPRYRRDTKKAAGGKPPPACLVNPRPCFLPDRLARHFFKSRPHRKVKREKPREGGSRKDEQKHQDSDSGIRHPESFRSFALATCVGEKKTSHRLSGRKSKRCHFKIARD